MFLAWRDTHTGKMIEIEFLGLEPPEGSIRLTGVPASQRSKVDFAGWTGLIQAILQLVTMEGLASSSGGLGGELGPRRHLQLPKDIP